MLYWNKVFGKEALRVEIAPDGMTAPDFEHNIIQWHTDHETGAYADAQMNPLTGEILHAQIFVSTAFTEYTRGYDLPKFDRMPHADEVSETASANGNTPQINETAMAKQMGEAVLCRMDENDVGGDFYQLKGDISSLSSERLDVLANDYLRWVVAHEVGHTMGLRHNFAASTADNRKGADALAMARAYISGGNLSPDAKAPISSVMEYPSSLDRIITGAMLGKPDSKPLPYDRYAIQWGYFGSEKKPDFQGELFCTDSAVGKYADCAKKDSGAHIIERSAFEVSQSFANLPWLLSEFYLNAKADLNPRNRKAVTNATPRSIALTTFVMQPWLRMIGALSGSAPLMSIMVKHPDINEADLASVAGEQLGWINSEIEFAGGVEKVLSLLASGGLEARFKNAPEEFKKIIRSDDFRKAKLPEGGDISWSDDEIAYMEKRATKIFPTVRDQMAQLILLNLGDGQLMPISDAEKAEEIIATFAGSIVTSGSGLDFTYSHKTRLGAAKFLLSAKGPLPDWLQSSLPAIADELKRHLEKGLGFPLGDAALDKVPREKRQRIEDELGIYTLLAPRKISRTS